ncbi:MAG: hypothetical protein BAJATHORv1_90093 [Candidatus Thorarchaeota archaeon]|nr:MAG: hypothetical protein BAJATHORv1_90093 [Candidatus Thorarchaeota archaeon]
MRNAICFYRCVPRSLNAKRVRAKTAEDDDKHNIHNYEVEMK